MENRYLLADQTIDEKDIQDLVEWLKTNPWLTQGPLVQEFQNRWAEWLGIKYSIFVNSGSSANLLMYYALLLSGKLKNSKVIVPAVSWATTVSPAIQLGLDPIMCEAEWDTFGLDLNHLEDLLKRHNPAAVIIVHVLGVPNQMEELLELKQRYGFLLMEDACAATGSQYDRQPVGTFGEISTFSFFFGHHLSTIEGGMICTNDETLHDILLQIRSHGWAKDLEPDKARRSADEHSVIEFNRPFTFYYPGFNVRSTDLNARIGLSQLNKVDHVVRRRVENHRAYQRRFLDLPRFHCQRNDRATSCSISFAVLAESIEHRESIAAVLKESNIETRPLGGGNMARQPYWATRYGQQTFPIADRIHTTALQLPNHPRLSENDVDYICDTVVSAT